MARTDPGTYTPESLATIVSALQSIEARISRTAEAMKEKKVPSLEIKDQAALKAAIASLRGFGMAAEEALEEKVFDQSLFKEVAEAAEPAPEPERPRAGRKQRKEQDVAAADEPQE